MARCSFAAAVALIGSFVIESMYASTPAHTALSAVRLATSESIFFSPQLSNLRFYTFHFTFYIFPKGFGCVQRLMSGHTEFIMRIAKLHPSG